MLTFEEHRATPHVAEDALELVRVDWDPLPAVASIEAALAPGAPRLYDDWHDNVAESGLPS